jgi:apolipoprotein N-acyltransferase
MLAGSIDRLPREEVELVALPETALPGFVRYDTPLADWARDVVIRTERPLLFGALDRSDSGAETYNASFMITPFGTVTVYRKLRLAPVAESLAFLGRLEGWLEGWREIGFPTTPGAEVTLFRLRDGTAFATPICYEDAFAELARRFANAGAQLLVSLIDTERLGDSIAEQHLRRARLTAIAVGLPIVRVTNSASSSVIDRRGRTTERIRADQLHGVLEAVLWSTATPYRRFGELLGLAIMVVLTVGMISLAAAFPRPISVSAG